MNIEAIRIGASVVSIIGSSLLAYRVTGILLALSVAAHAHEMNIAQLIEPNRGQPLVHFHGSSELIEKSKKRGLLYAGFALVILSGSLQLSALVLVSLAK